MEGLQPPTGEEFRSLYGGGNDDDDSGSINYLSLRYGGKVIGLANELNGLSLGGIGRETDDRPRRDHEQRRRRHRDLGRHRQLKYSRSGTSATTASTSTRAGAARPSSA
jgi:hypothetical protein